MKQSLPFTISKQPSGLVDAKGFEAAGVSSDVRGDGDKRLDTALIHSATPCTAAGVFTRNTFAAAPVRLSRMVLAQGIPIHGIVANSGNANACTGAKGLKDAESMQQHAASAVGSDPDSFFVCSTGHIGIPLPMTKLCEGIQKAGKQKSTASEAGIAAADAILTSDTRRKLATVCIKENGAVLTIAGMAKGAGMIQPNMATMLAFLATDAQVASGVLQDALEYATRQSFNAITIDGDESTNDTVLFLANGVSGVKIPATADSLLNAAFREAVSYICRELSAMIVSDGERISKVVEIKVSGARNGTEAEKVARAIGNSFLVKASWFGNDPNWGRVMDAAGYSGVEMQEEHVDLRYYSNPDSLKSVMQTKFKEKHSGDTKPPSSSVVLKQGAIYNKNHDKWKTIVSQPCFGIDMRIGQGEGSFSLLASDITDGYFRFNKTE